MLNDLDIKKGEIVLVVLPNSACSEETNPMAEHMSSRYNSIVYVSLNSITETILKKLEGSNVDKAKFSFIDCATKMIKPSAKDTRTVTYLDSISSLTDLSIAITKKMETKKHDAMVFDSLSTLLLYNNPPQACKFVHALVNRMRALGVSAVFTAAESDMNGELLKETQMYMDRVIRQG